MKTQYQENITITGNQKDNVIIYIQARSLQKKVKDWTRINDKWKPLEYEWVEWLEQMSKPVYFQRSINPNFRSIKRSEMIKFFLLCDLSGIEVRCRMKRKGSFTDDEWKLINEHFKMVKWEDKREEISLPNKTIPTKDEILYLLHKSTMLDSDARKYQNECCEEYLEYYETYKTKEDQDKIDRELKENLKYIKNS